MNNYKSTNFKQKKMFDYFFYVFKKILLLLVNFAKRILRPFPKLYIFFSKIYFNIKMLVYGSSPSAEASMTGRDTLYISKNNGLINISVNNNSKNFSLNNPYEAKYEDKIDFSENKTEIKAIAFHLPQFHSIPENDRWWGEGFTEWSNTRKAKPLFPGHYQPREPHPDIGYYDLSDIKTLKCQVDMAKKFGIYGFCFYHYWFHGTRLLGRPVDMLLGNKDIEMPFCLCWANETWSKKWDGKDHHILIEQKFSPEDDLQFIEFLAPYFRDPRYIRVNGRPILLVYRVSKLPSPLETVSRWRTWCQENGLGEIHLVAVCHGEVYPNSKLIDIGFDAYAEFPPHCFPCQHIPSENSLFGDGYRFDYSTGVDASIESNDSQIIYKGCTLGWDNTARFGKNATIYLNFSIKKYYFWLCHIIDYTRKKFNEHERFIFINAWNEWAEGTYLEPDKRYGYVYLNTTSKALFGIPFEENCAVKDGEGCLTADRYEQNYDWLKKIIRSNGDHSLAAVNKYIVNNCKILEFGSAGGYFTRYLREERDAVVDIVEIDHACARRAGAFARDLSIGDIENYTWKSEFFGRKYDYILFADVLEHLRDPWRVLKEATDMLQDGGKIIISVPNIAHVQVLACLYNDDFSYGEYGILDKTHLRFFTETTFRQMILESGLHIVDLVPVNAENLPEGCGTKLNKKNIPMNLYKILSSKNNPYAMQFVACCSNKIG
ncbi:MAG: methyltransferase domain-containing protein [Verrucomicrobiae bacterium]|nr:methyltransferase domain-containing protein [Verrucomicrobiae bacterium]